MEDKKALKFIKQSLCPFCQCENLCEINTKKKCWCFETEVPKELIALLSENAERKNCICLKCINQFNRDPEGFKEYHKNNKLS